MTRVSWYVRQVDSSPAATIRPIPDQAIQSGIWSQTRAESKAAKMMVLYCRAAVSRADPIPKARVMASCPTRPVTPRSEEHTSELQSRENLVCRLLLEKKKKFDLCTKTS